MPVLLVEDDTALRSLISTLLSRSAIDVEMVSGGDVAVERLAAGRYEAIILDLLLPGRTGFEVLEHLYTHQASLLSRVIVVTAISERDLRRRFVFEDVVWRLVRKPFDIQELVGSVRACVASHSTPTAARLDLASWLREQAEEVGAAAAAIALIGIHNEMQLVASYGSEADRCDAFFPLAPHSNVPICRAARTGQPVFVASLLEEPSSPMMRRMMLLPQSAARQRRAVAALPLKAAGHSFGAMAWAFINPQAFASAQRERLLDVADGCASMLRPLKSDLGPLALRHGA